MQDFLEKLKGTKGLPLLVGLMILGIFLFVLSYMLPKADTHLSGDLGYASTPLEQRLADVLGQIEGAGEVKVMIHIQGSDENVVGVIVVAEGAQELMVRTELMRAAMTALDIPAKAVDVFAMQKSGEDQP